MSIHANHHDPPRRAFETLFRPRAEQEQKILGEWQGIEKQPSTNLNTVLLTNNGFTSMQKLLSPRVVLAAQRIDRARALAALHGVSTPAPRAATLTGGASGDWASNLPMRERDRLEAAENRGADFGSHLVPSEPTPAMTRITGQVRLNPGLLAGDRAIEVRHFVDGIPSEVGSMDFSSGKFSIDVADPQGDVVAQIFDQRGQVVGSGSYRISPPAPGEAPAKKPANIPVSQKNQIAYNFDNFNTNPSSLDSRTNSSRRGVAADVMVPSLATTQKTDALGGYQYAGVSEESWVLMRVRAENFRESIMIRPAGEPQTVMLMPEKLVSVLDSITAPANTSGGIIWGQVMYDGKPLAGASLEIGGHPEIQPIYLSGFIPGEGALATFANGYFVFKALDAGMYEVVAKRAGQMIGHLNLQVDEGAISTGTVELTSHQAPVAVKVYDAFSGEPVGANMDLQSLPEELPVPSGMVQIQLPEIHNLSYGYVYPESGEYVGAQLVYTDDAEFIHAPLVRQDWLTAVVGQQKVNVDPDAGTIIGFVTEDNFEVYLPHEANYSTANIVYFDSSGRVSEHGVQGGGFILFNVPPGTQSVVVVAEKSQIVNSHVLPVDVGSTSILSVHL